MVTIEFKNVSKNFIRWHNRPDSIKRFLVNFVRGHLEVGRRDRISLLENINFQIKQGEFVGIMGRNGSGKSTILKMISKIYSPNEGEVNVNGQVAPLLALGAGFSEELSGYENIFLNASILGFSRKEVLEKISSIIEFSELGEHIEYPVKKYSSGMLVRLAFSIAAHMNSSILLFDEVLGVGDVGFQNKCLKKIDELYKQGRTILLVTHSPEQVLEHCNRVLFIDQKRLAYDGPAAEGVKMYMDLFK